MEVTQSQSSTHSGTQSDSVKAVPLEMFESVLLVEGGPLDEIESSSKEFGIPEKNKPKLEETRVCEATNKIHSMDNVLMPPPSSRPQGQLRSIVKHGIVNVEPGSMLEFHNGNCLYALWNSDQARLLTKEELRSAFMEHYMKRKSWNNPGTVNDANRKCDEAFAEDGLVMYYLKTQKEAYANMRQHIRRQCRCPQGKVRP